MQYPPLHKRVIILYLLQRQYKNRFFQNALDILAVGPATSALLKAEYDLTATIPAQGVGGVALLANFDPSYWQHRKVGVVRSVDAPTDLLDELTSLNAKVLVLNVYQRQLNHVAYSAVEQFVAAPHRIKIVTGFSSDSLSALRKVAADKFSQLASMPLIVVYIFAKRCYSFRVE